MYDRYDKTYMLTYRYVHLHDIINTTGAEVSFPTEEEVADELMLKRLYSVYTLPFQPRPQRDTI